MLDDFNWYTSFILMKSQAAQFLKNFGHNITEQRLGSDLDIAIAVQNHELTEQERNKILSKIGRETDYLRLKSEDKDFFNQKIFQVWLAERFGGLIARADEGVLGKVEPLDGWLTQSKVALAPFGSGMTEKCAGDLLSLGLEPDQDKKKALGELAVGRVQSFLDTLDQSQTKVGELLSSGTGFPGKDAVQEYFAEFRAQRILDVAKVVEKLKEIVLR